MVLVRRKLCFLSFALVGVGGAMLCPVTAAHAQLSVDVNVGIDVPAYPELVLVPGYPVYYDPRASSNYFFYDGLYWVYEGDNWYASSWYNGPWQLTGPEYVPLFVLRVPVRYYRQPPVYFRGWRADAPPRWGEHWGRGWEQRRAGWARWDRRSAPPPAALPVYQRQYSGGRYPRAAEQQHSIRAENYRYQPRDAVTQQHFRQHGNPGNARAERQQQAPARQRSPPPQRQAQPQPAQTQRPQAAPQNKGRENKAEPRGNGREHRNEEHGQDHR